MSISDGKYRYFRDNYRSSSWNMHKVFKMQCPLPHHLWVGPNDRNTFGNTPWNALRRKISYKNSFNSVVSNVWKMPISWDVRVSCSSIILDEFVGLLLIRPSRVQTSSSGKQYSFQFLYCRRSSVCRITISSSISSWSEFAGCRSRRRFHQYMLDVPSAEFCVAHGHSGTPLCIMVSWVPRYVLCSHIRYEVPFVALMHSALCTLIKKGYSEVGPWSPHKLRLFRPTSCSLKNGHVPQK